MKQQNYANHRQIVPIFHFGVTLICITLITCSTISLYRHWSTGQGKMLPAIALLGSVGLLLVAFLSRTFALKAQDRAIRAEENLRHFSLTGKLLDSKLRLSQIIALRFASNDEFVQLANDAAEKGTSANKIKNSIKNWRADYRRV